MAGLPYNFISGDIARSAEVNANFEAIMDMLGGGSDPSRIVPPGEFLVGKRSNVLFTGKADTGPAEYRFYQIGYNADFNEQPGGGWKFKRFRSSEPATAIRIGEEGFEVFTTSITGGDLNAHMKRAFKVKATTSEDRFVMGNNWHIQNVDRLATSIQDYGLRRTVMQTPPMIYNNVFLGAGTSTKKMTDFGVHEAAKMVTIGVHVTASSGSQATLKVTQARNPIEIRYGGAVTAPAGLTASGQIDVQLGEETHIAFERTANFANAYVYIHSYWV